MGRSFLNIFVLITFILIIFGCGGGGGSDSGSGSSPVPNWIGVTCQNSNYRLEKIMSTSFGLPFQISMLPDGRIVIADPNNIRIVMIDGNSVEVLDEGGDLFPYAVSALPDGRVCFGHYSGAIFLLNPDTFEKRLHCELPNGTFPLALACDINGTIYAATFDRSVYSISGFNISKIAGNLPLDNINDIEISNDGTIYVSGREKVVAIKNGLMTTIVDGLNYEPVWIDVTPNGMLYINELSQGLQEFDPLNNSFTNIRPDNFLPFGDIIAIDKDRIIFYDFEVFYNYDFLTKTAYPIFSIIGNGFSLSVDNEDTAYFETPGKNDVLEQYIVNINQDGVLAYRNDLSFKSIRSTSIDYENRLCLFTDNGLKRVEVNGQISNIAENMDLSKINELREFSVGPNGLWYMVTTDFDNNIQVSRFDDEGNIENLPIFFNRQSFGGATVRDTSIDVGLDGSIAIIVTATVSRSHGPFLQRVYRADEDGNNLTLVANFDSKRVDGMVDIALGSNNEIFVLTSQGTTGGPEVIYKIDQNNSISPFVIVQAGNDPKSIDTGPNGSLWFSTTEGIFRAYPK